MYQNLNKAEGEIIVRNPEIGGLVRDFWNTLYDYTVMADKYEMGNGWWNVRLDSYGIISDEKHRYVTVFDGEGQLLRYGGYELGYSHFDGIQGIDLDRIAGLVEAREKLQILTDSLKDAWSERMNELLSKVKEAVSELTKTYTPRPESHIYKHP